MQGRGRKAAPRTGGLRQERRLALGIGAAATAADSC
jgi:hypothetical protein